MDNGPLWEAQNRLKVTLADCEAFREWTATETPAKARARIYHYGLPAPAGGDVDTVAELAALRPYALVATASEGGLTLSADSVGEGTEFIDGGTLAVRLVQNCPDGLDDEPTGEANEEWSKTIGRIIKDLCKLSGKSDLTPYLAFHEIRVEDGPYWPHRDRIPGEGLWQAVELAIEWGMAGR